MQIKLVVRIMEMLVVFTASVICILSIFVWKVVLPELNLVPNDIIPAKGHVPDCFRAEEFNWMRNGWCLSLINRHGLFWDTNTWNMAIAFDYTNGYNNPYIIVETGDDQKVDEIDIMWVDGTNNCMVVLQFSKQLLMYKQGAVRMFDSPQNGEWDVRYDSSNKFYMVKNRWLRRTSTNDKGDVIEIDGTNFNIKLSRSGGSPILTAVGQVRVSPEWY